jgi:hypothetical protein
VEQIFDNLQANTEYRYRLQYRKPGESIFRTRPECRFHTQRAAGSTFTILTPLGSIHLHDGNFVIEVQPDQVRISLVAGEGTVYGGEFDLGGHLIKTGDQAIIRPGASGRANLVTVGKFPALELDVLQAAADMARAARKTVFFQTDETGEINALPVVVPSVPVQATVSPSRLPN